ncbi:NAD(P)-dependent oxidoreductase [Streptomyces boninensis]|uniref:NAD(P)-dependent oxidoreductase n=1 Tax=Streptomyces boninensis TaxID=2039455 RepID=UPI003B2254B6
MPTTPKPHITVIGLGPMGHAMATAFRAAGHPVTVWNRTPGRATALLDQGATEAATVPDALDAGDLTVLSLTDYPAMYAILDPYTPHLHGKTLVNLSSDTPEQARKGAAWAAGHGAGFLSGGVGAAPSGIGDPENSFTYYSGDKALFETHEPTLGVLTRTDYRGSDPGLAQLHYQLQMAMFWPAMLSYVHATALARANGISAAELLPYAVETLGSLPHFAEFYAPRIDAGHHEGDVDRLTMAEASIDHVRHTAADSGVSPGLNDALFAAVRRAIADGRGAHSLTSLGDLFAENAAASAAATR